MSAAAAVFPGPQPPRHRNPPPRGWCKSFKDAPVPAKIGEYMPLPYAVPDCLETVLSAVERRIFLYIFRWTYGDWQAWRPERRVFTEADLAAAGRCSVAGVRKAVGRMASDFYGAKILDARKSGIGGKGKSYEYTALIENLGAVEQQPVRTFVRHAPPSGAAAKWVARSNPAEPSGGREVPEEVPETIQASVSGPVPAAALRIAPAAGPLIVLPGRDRPVPLSEACPKAAECPLFQSGMSETHSDPDNRNKGVTEIIMNSNSLGPGIPHECDPLILMPGEQSRPMPLSGAIRAVRYRNATAAPLALLVSSIRAGECRLEIQAHREHSAVPGRTPLDLAALRAALMQVRRFGTAGTAGPRLAEKLHSLPSGKIIEETARNLSGAPVEDLLGRIQYRWEAITSWALVAKLALEDVGPAWRAGEAERRKAQSAAAREEAAERQGHQEMEREMAREAAARDRFDSLPDEEKQRLRAAKDRELRTSDPARYRRMSGPARAEEIDEMLLRDLAQEGQNG